MHNEFCEYAEVLPVNIELERQLAIASLKRAEFAYRHPLGFLHIGVSLGESGSYTRLHVWRGGGQVDDIPHSHTSAMHSTILVGDITNIEWQLSETPNAIESHVYKVTSITGEKSYNSFAFNAKFVRIAERKIKEKQCYMVPSGIFHSNICSSRICITLVRRDRKRLKNSLVAANLEEGEFELRTAVALEPMWKADIIKMLERG